MMMKKMSKNSSNSLKNVKYDPADLVYVYFEALKNCANHPCVPKIDCLRQGKNSPIH